MCAAVYRERHLVKATKVNAGLAESNGRLLLGRWRDSLHVTCGLTACTPGSAPGPTLGNEYGKTLPFLYPQNGDHIVAIDSVTSFHSMYTAGCTVKCKQRVTQQSAVSMTAAVGATQGVGNSHRISRACTALRIRHYRPTLHDAISYRAAGVAAASTS